LRATRASRTRTAGGRRAWQGRWSRAAWRGSRGPPQGVRPAGLGPIQSVIVNQEDLQGRQCRDPRSDRRRHARPDDWPTAPGREEHVLGPMLHATRSGARCSPSPLRAPTIAAYSRARSSRRTASEGIQTARRVDDQSPVRRRRRLLAAPMPVVPKHNGPDDVHRPDGPGSDRTRLPPDLGEAEFNEVSFGRRKARRRATGRPVNGDGERALTTLRFEGALGRLGLGSAPVTREPSSPSDLQRPRTPAGTGHSQRPPDRGRSEVRIRLHRIRTADRAAEGFR